MNYGKTIELFLVNGTADDVVTAELSNWNAQAIRIPRTECRNPTHKHIADALKGVGVYFLVCQNDGDKEGVYVGEAEDVHSRLRRHLQDYDSGREDYYWNYVIAFVGGRLDKALIRYLEKRLCAIVKECDRCECLTQKTGRKIVLKPSQVATMDEFINNIRVVLLALGSRMLVPQPCVTQTTVIFQCTGRGANAKGFPSTNGFTVIKGSRISPTIAPMFESTRPGYYGLRQRLEAAGMIVENQFVRNYEFSSPSSASSVIQGVSSSGNRDWKTDSGQPLGAL